MDVSVGYFVEDMVKKLKLLITLSTIAKNTIPNIWNAIYSTELTNMTDPTSIFRFCQIGKYC